MAEAVGVVFSGGGRVYSFDPAGLELAWNERVICQTSRGQEFGRVVQANHELEAPPAQPLKKVVRRATDVDGEALAENKREAKAAMRLFRELLRRDELPLKPVAAELVFDRSRIVISYQAEERQSVSKLQAELARELGRRVELSSVGPRECARLCGDHGLCGGKHCSRRFPSHEQPITLRMAKDQDLPVASGRITGLCGRLRCCLAFEHPLYRRFRDRAPRVGRRVETPQGVGVVREYRVLEDACVVAFEDDATGVAVAVDDCRELSAADAK
jgi:cell fate regulator YaaT (PSP1 superfamily)